MKNIGMKVLCGALLCGAFLSVNNVSAASYNYDITSKFQVTNNTYIRAGDKVCVKTDSLPGTKYLYAWDTSNGNHSLAGWPGVILSDDEGVYCYTHRDDGYHYNMVIFDNNNKKTIDLSVVNDSGNLVKSLAYLFDESDKITEGNQYGRYVGRWAVKDTDALVAMVNEADGLDKDVYTITSYAAVEAALGDNVEVGDVNVDNQDQWDLGAYYISQLNLSNDVLKKLIITNDGNGYESEYLDAYNALGAAMNNLVERKVILVDENTTNGSVSAGYQSGSDNDIDIEVSPELGYEVESITVKEITSFDQSGDPVFGGETALDVDPDVNNYEFSFGESGIAGYYVTATFKMKTYNITFVVGENGEIKTIGDEDIESPVQVYYGEDYSLKIIAKEGYKIDTILVNGEEYSMEDGVLTIENIMVDTEVRISFKLQSYVITVDGKEYSFNYGTTYEQMLEGIDLEKEGYKFLYLVDENGEKVTDDYVIQGDAEFTAVYEEEGAATDEEDIAVPDTGSEQGFGEGIKYSLIGCASVGAVMGAALMVAKQRRDGCKNK